MTISPEIMMNTERTTDQLRRSLREIDAVQRQDCMPADNILSKWRKQLLDEMLDESAPWWPLKYLSRQ
jgi:hypothetical protein